jgi:tetratricopeptide (TPR) repeat protein
MSFQKRLGLVILLAGALLAPGARADDAQHQHPAGPTETVGQVHFPVSCNAAAQKEFDRAVATLHSFWYEIAEKTFTAVTQADGTCAMGYWGIAMSLYHPIWGEPAGPATLQKGLAAIEKGKAVGAKTPRERDYIAAIETYYKDCDKLNHPARARAYEKAMEQVHVRHPDDREASVFYALALLSTAPPTDKTYANQKKAAALLEAVFAVEPDHPGVAHYFIHAYDHPELAPLALPAARRYARIAPAVPHALHMPSHIFTRLGLWQDSIQSNLASADAARKFARDAHMEGVWDQQVHAMDYLAYAYLQGAQDTEAKHVLDELTAIQKAQPENLTSAYAFAAIPARFALERRRWSEATSLELRPAGFPWSRYPWPEGTLYFARAVGAAHSGHPEQAKKDLQRIEMLHKDLVEAKELYWADQLEIVRREAAAWVAYASGKSEDALQVMHSAADLEDSTDKHPVTPGAVLPAHEQLGDLLLELRQPAAALHEYEVSLRNAPNRFNSLYGAARSAELAGQQAKAREYYAKLLEVSKFADSDRPELREARTLSAKQ